MLKDIGSDVRRVPTSEPVEISVDGVLVVSLLHERRVQPHCSLDECFRTRACCVEAVELTCDDAILASRRQLGARVRKLVDLESLLLQPDPFVKQRRSPPGAAVCDGHVELGLGLGAQIPIEVLLAGGG